jgi:hypothetical protein
VRHMSAEGQRSLEVFYVCIPVGSVAAAADRFVETLVQTCQKHQASCSKAPICF